LQSAAYNSDLPNEIILEYNGPKNSLTNQNRIASGCPPGKSPCAKIFSEVGPNGKKIQWSCEEFPFAASAQGGGLAAMICIPQKINSSFGGRWGAKVKGKAKGTKIRIKIKGIDCSKAPLKAKRSPKDRETGNAELMKRASTVLKNDTNSEVIYVDASTFGNNTDGKVAMVIPLDIPDGFVGTFNIDYKLASGSLKSGFIMDDDGEDYGP
jgi:hypothetical protein